MSTSTNQNILMQIDTDDPIEIVGNPSNSWYKVRYNTSGSTGYVSSSYLSVRASSYGRVLRLTGCPMKSEAGSYGTTIYTVPYNTTMPYKTSKTVSQDLWMRCVTGITSGWVQSGNNYDFKYQDIA